MRRGVARTRGALVAALVAAAVAACGEDEPEMPAEAPVVPIPEAAGARDVAVIDVDGFGTIRVELLPELAPETVAHFQDLVREGYYDGTTFHRVIPDFAIQGGDPNSRDRDPRNDGMGGRDREIDLETSEVSFLRGAVAMANRRGPASSGPQFFITVEDARGLDGRFALFGQVVEGMDVADAISRVSADTYGRYGPKNRPLEDVVMTVRIEEDAGGTAAARAGPTAGAAVEGGGEPEASEDEGSLGSGEWREGAP